MTDYPLTDQLRQLHRQAEDLLETEIIFKRMAEAPKSGYLLDSFLSGNDRSIIIFPEDALGTLKDFTIAKHLLKLVIRGSAYREEQGKVLVFDESSAIRGMHQIYLDSLKDDRTRTLSFSEKRTVIPDLYLLFHERLMDLPWAIAAHIILSKQCPVFRNPQVYSLLQESQLDMHELDGRKDHIPLRYLVMHQGMYYARDMLLAFKLSEYSLHPEINLPEFQIFRNINVQQMMEYRWSGSPWVHTKIIGEAMANLMDIALNLDLDQDMDIAYYRDLSRCVMDATHRWIDIMSMQDWYYWDSPWAYRKFLETRINTCQSVLGRALPG
jgi:hypothetical protein